AAETAQTVAGMLQEEQYLFVFSVNFFPAVSEVCQICRVPYVCWTVDCPVMELFSPALANDCNRVFLFDRAQYECFAPRAGKRNVYHLPLATNPARWDQVIADAGEDAKERFGAEVSFVGSLYTEKNRYREIRDELREYTKGSLDALAEAQTHLYGYAFLEERLTGDIIQELEALVPAMRGALCAGDAKAKRAYSAHMLLDWEATQRERVRLLESVAQRFALSLYTHSDASFVPHAKVRPGVQTLTEMPLVFRYSKINLNITMRSIEKGLPLRIFDICGAGGFLLTNYQEELAEQYAIGEEVECFASEEELLDKIAFYLENDDARERIARKGYERTRAEHTYFHRMHAMIQELSG
ncbi:MAG: glycosyltransferase, partial [Lachnospiraceae bacterium]|nr:glycosyltransferase [Lachnospiraceae bacterium]